MLIVKIKSPLTAKQHFAIHGRLEGEKFRCQTKDYCLLEIHQQQQEQHPLNL